MTVYMIRCGENGPVKIGHSTDPENRLVQLQISHWETLRIMRLFHGGEAEELKLHARFVDQHIRGEWHHFSRMMLGDVGLVETYSEVSPPVKRATRPLHTVPDEMDEARSQLLREIDSFLLAHGMAESTFGRRAVDDGKFVSRLRMGANVWTSTVVRVRAFISAREAA